MSKHWAYELVNKPWTADGQGPDSFSCWGLVRHVFRTQHGVEMPMVVINDELANNVRSIKQAAQVSGWHRVPGTEGKDGDIVIFPGARLHVGLVVKANSRLGVLESLRGSGVVWRPWVEAMHMVQSIELWRKVE